jgi:hypothetical protein
MMSSNSETEDESDTRSQVAAETGFEITEFDNQEAFKPLFAQMSMDRTLSLIR